MPTRSALSFQFAFIALLCLGGCSQRSNAPPAIATASETASAAAAPGSAATSADTAPNTDNAAAAAQAAVTTRDAMQLHRIEQLVHAGAAQAGVYAAPSEAELKARYDQYVAALPPNEFHVAHILVPSERMARALIAELQAGAEFAQLARAESADDSRAQGGDLGWISPGKLPAAFTAAVRGLQPGQFTSRPVHTMAGWHVIKLLATKSSAAPPYDQLKAQLAVDIQQQRYEKFLAGALPKLATAPSSSHQ